MTNEKVTLADLRLIEKDLHRELTDDEAYVAYTQGWKALFEKMNLTDEKYVAYRRLVELLVTYCTKDRMEFEKLRNAKDYNDSFELLGDFVEACKVELPAGNFEFDDECEDEDDEMTEDEVILYYVENFPDSEIHWLKQYVELDSEMPELRKYIHDLTEDDEDHIVEEEIGNVVDLVKDAVVEKTAARLAKTGEAEKLPEDLLAEVCEYIDNNWTNYSMRVVNGVIKVKKY